jgi:hypothetical protein
MRVSLILFLLNISFAAQAAEPAPYTLSLHFPLYDSARHQVSGFSPSLGQAHALTLDYYQSVHWGLATAFGSKAEYRSEGWETVADIVFAIASNYISPGTSWLHEEAHRAVLNQYGISSHNGIYNASFGDDAIPVDRVRDRDLERLKRDHPADFVRLSTAGMEAESQLALHLESETFLQDVLPRAQFLILMSHLGPIAYRSFCDSKDGDKATADDLAEEGPDERQRDFTGYDCVSYVYDLYRPYEPYADRGPHPSGEGIARYRSRQDLTSTERAYLHRMALYSFANLLDPFIFQFKGWQWEDWRWTATLRHHLAPFGHSFEENIFLRRGQDKHLFIVRQYSNQRDTRPGVEWQCLDCLHGEGGRALDVKTAFWWQPVDLLFASRSWQAGGYLALRYKQELWSQINGFAEVLSKTRGWLADEVDLGPATHLRVGLSWSLR